VGGGEAESNTFAFSVNDLVTKRDNTKYIYHISERSDTNNEKKYKLIPVFHLSTHEPVISPELIDWIDEKDLIIYNKSNG
jgi:hypothetical protein